MPPSLSRDKAIGYLIEWVPVLFVGWVMVLMPWRDSHRTLPELNRASGFLASDTIQRSNDKTHTWRLYIVLQDCPQWFGIEQHKGAPPLDTLQKQVRAGQRITVYYDTDWVSRLLGTALHTDVYQLESGGKVLPGYGLKENQARFADNSSSGLIMLGVFYLIGGLVDYFRRRPNA